jgi:hypothetical protein
VEAWQPHTSYGQYWHTIFLGCSLSTQGTFFGVHFGVHVTGYILYPKMYPWNGSLNYAGYSLGYISGYMRKCMPVFLSKRNLGKQINRSTIIYYLVINLAMNARPKLFTTRLVAGEQHLTFILWQSKPQTTELAGNWEPRGALSHLHCEKVALKSPAPYPWFDGRCWWLL